MSIIEKALKSRESRAKNRQEARESSTDRSALERGADFLERPPENAVHADSAAPADTVNTSVGKVAQAPQTQTRWRGTEGEEGSQAASSPPHLVLDFDALQARGYLTPFTPRSRMADEFRTIKRPLLRNIAGSDGAAPKHANLVMVTSALQGDGKTFSSINLAISIAMEQDKTVLFVDADVVRATAGKTLGVPPGTPGLIDLLREDSTLDPSDVIMRTNIDKLRVLPAGNASDKSTELLASDIMQHFMIELSLRYPDRVIVFDSPPLLLTTEATVLASFMGQIVFVASADVTPQHAVTEALEHIGEDKMVGVVLNRASRRRSKLLGIGSYGYGYGYGKGYGYGDSPDPDRSPEPAARS